jgi:hypothetical protein
MLQLCVYYTSTVPPSLPAFFWNMYSWGTIAAASTYMETVQQVSEKNSRLSPLREKKNRELHFYVEGGRCDSTYGWNIMASTTAGPTM